MKNALKNNSVTMIKINILTDAQIKVFEDEIQPEMGKIFDENDDKFIAVEEINGADVIFLFVEESKVDALIELLDKYDMIDFSKEVSEEILKEELDAELLSIMVSEDFKPMFDSFILKNLDCDMVLDKITSKGMESLTENDKMILDKGV